MFELFAEASPQMTPVGGVCLIAGLLAGIGMVAFFIWMLVDSEEGGPQ